MTQYPRGEILLAAIGINELPIDAERHCIDGEISALEIRLERHRGVRMNDKTAMSFGSFSLGSRKCDLGMADRV